MTWIPPDPGQVQRYIGQYGSWSVSLVGSALEAETAAQLQILKLPVDPDPDTPRPYPADLAEALCRRVHRNLAMRNLPLGFQAISSDAAVMAARVGQDPEIRRLEAPYRKRVVA